MCIFFWVWFCCCVGWSWMEWSLWCCSYLWFWIGGVLMWCCCRFWEWWVGCWGVYRLYRCCGSCWCYVCRCWGWWNWLMVLVFFRDWVCCLLDCCWDIFCLDGFSFCVCVVRCLLLVECCIWCVWWWWFFWCSEWCDMLWRVCWCWCWRFWISFLLVCW